MLTLDLVVTFFLNFFIVVFIEHFTLLRPVFSDKFISLLNRNIYTFLSNTSLLCFIFLYIFLFRKIQIILYYKELY